MSSPLYVGKRLSYDGNRCTIRYVGTVTGTKGEWLGIEWDDPTRGKHDGQAGGHRYFQCVSDQPTAGSFVRPNRPSDPRRSFLEALRFKYASEDALNPASSPANIVRISGKKAEEVGFDKINKRLAILNELRIVLLDDLNISEDTALYASDTSEFVAAVQDTCPKIGELDLSRNLFENIVEVALISQGLKRLKALRLDGNRFSKLDFDSQSQDSLWLPFQRIDTLSLENTLLSWSQAIELCQLFTNLSSLNLSDNQLSDLSFHSVMTLSLPLTISTLNLSANNFVYLSELEPITRLPSLRTLLLNHGKIQHVSQGKLITFQATLKRVEFAFNEIDSWQFISRLPVVFPGLNSLRISHNPLFQSLQSVEGRPLSSEHGYMLTIARLGQIKSLNFSPISEKERLDAETYYLGQIQQELKAGASESTKTILDNHPRWNELCLEYGEPEIHREIDQVDPNSLAASLITLRVICEDQQGEPWESPSGHSFEIELPKRLPVYGVIGIIARKVGLLGTAIQLYWETGDWRYVVQRHETASEEWDSDDSNDADGEMGERLLETIHLVPTTRSIGNIIDRPLATVTAKITI